MQSQLSRVDRVSMERFQVPSKRQAQLLHPCVPRQLHGDIGSGCLG